MAAIATLAAWATTVPGAEILGAKPAYLDETTRSFPNAHAVTPRIWAPGLDEGWTAQGLVIMGKYALVSSYQDVDPRAPKCRVFRIALETGAAAGSFDLPEPCGHAGGIADLGGGLVVVADRHQDWRIDLEKALATGHAEGATRGTINLAGGLRADFTFFDGNGLWNGVYVTGAHAADAKIYRLDLGLFDRAGAATATRETPLEVVPIPPLAQGAAFDRDGNLWLAASSGPSLAYLYRLDRKSGNVLARYGMPPRIEGISFDAQGRLWAISEAGARKYRNGRDDFPFIFEIDIGRLTPMALQ